MWTGHLSSPDLKEVAEGASASDIYCTLLFVLFFQEWKKIKVSWTISSRLFLHPCLPLIPSPLTLLCIV